MEAEILKMSSTFLMFTLSGLLVYYKIKKKGNCEKVSRNYARDLVERIDHEHNMERIIRKEEGKRALNEIIRRLEDD